MYLLKSHLLRALRHPHLEVELQYMQNSATAMLKEDQTHLKPYRKQLAYLKFRRDSFDLVQFYAVLDY